MNEPVVSISAVDVRLIQVDPGAFNASGHWLGESGKLELLCSGGRTFADRWQISPTLQFQDLPPSSPESPRSKMTLALAVCSDRDSLYVAGEPAESVVVVDVGGNPARRNGVEILPVRMVMAMLLSVWPSAQPSRLTI
jgi:hypothetical protein